MFWEVMRWWFVVGGILTLVWATKYAIARKPMFRFPPNLTQKDEKFLYGIFLLFWSFLLTPIAFVAYPPLIFQKEVPDPD